MQLAGFPQRIMGLENEYGFVAVDKDGTHHEEKQVFELIHGLGLVSGESNGGWWPDNAARIYIDIGNHPEGSSPECLNGYQTVIYDRAIEEILVCRLAEMQSSSRVFKYRLIKNNLATDAEKPSRDAVFGCHENYLVASDIDYSQLVDCLIPFLVTRQLWAGAGLVTKHPGLGGFRFLTAQRSRHFGSLSSGGTTTADSRGIFCQRDEALADKNRFKRLQIIIGDSNILLVPAVLKLEVTSLLILLYENGELPLVQLEQPLANLRQLAYEWRAGVRLTNGKKVRGVDVQWHYYYAASRFVAKHQLDHYQPIVAQWGRILRALSDNDLDSLYGLVDWVTKRKIIDHFEVAAGKRLDYEQARNLDLQYHTLFGGAGLAAKLRRRHDPADMAQLVQRAISQPPPTRAVARKRFLQACKQYYGTVKPNWHVLKIDEGKHERVAFLGDPRAITSPELEVILRIMHRRIKEARKLTVVNA